MKFIKASLMSFIAANVSGTLIALFILKPTVNKYLIPHIRSEEDGLNFIGILGGYLIFSIILTYVLPKIVVNKSWIKKAVCVGFIYGIATFFVGHLITAGWSKMNIMAMAFSGFMDSFAGIFAALPVAYTYRNRENE